MANSVFSTDRPLLYDVDPWNTMGFGVPAFGNNVGTVNLPLATLVDEIGRLQLFIMTHVDAARSQPPSRNTIERIAKMINRVRSVLGTRMRDYNELRIEPGHAQPDQEVWNIHPVPYFRSPWVVNSWLREYNHWTMIALCNMMQHSDNALALTVTKAFASEVWVYFAEIKLLVGVTLIGLPEEEVSKDDFEFKDEHYLLYLPDRKIVSTEALNTPGRLFQTPTEDDLLPLIQGIPASLIAPKLRQYPVTSVEDYASTQPKPGTGAAGSSGGDAATAAPEIGAPQT